MRWQWKLGTFAGIDVFVHATFLLLIGWVGYSHWLEYGTLAKVAEGILFILALFLCVVLHEYGHALTARRYGIKTRDITLYPIGGVARLERMPDKPIEELWVALMGPAVNVVIAAIIFVYLYLSRGLVPMTDLTVASGSFAARLIAANIGQGLAFLLGLVGLFNNPFLLFIAFFVWIGASQEASMVQMRNSISGIPVTNAMQTRFETLAPSDRLARVVDLILSGSQQDFPVVEDGRFIGVLTREDFFKALAEQGQ